MTRHTPGPWVLSDDAVRRVVKGAGTKPRTVCIIEKWTTEPDARLIAAAPSLLAALERLVKATGQIGLIDSHVEEARRAALATLAEVTR